MTISAKNLLHRLHCSPQGHVMIEINSPGVSIMWKYKDAEGVIAGMTTKSGPYWVWNALEGGYQRFQFPDQNEAGV